MNAVAGSPDVPLCVELQGALLLHSLQHERRLAAVKQFPLKLVSRTRETTTTRAADRSAELPASLDVAAAGSAVIAGAPVHRDLFTWLQQQRQAGRRLIAIDDAACSAAPLAAGELFDDVLRLPPASRGQANPARRLLVEQFGERGFDYVGGQHTSDAVWKASRRAIVVGNTALQGRVRRSAEVEHVFARARPQLKTWLRALRIHQWVKNALIFAPAALAHVIFRPGIGGTCLLAFIAFSACASSVYVTNDLFDLDADRGHPHKYRRPFASGALSVRLGLAMALALALVAATIALCVNRWFALVLLGYYVTTWAYSIKFKRAMLFDVMLLAGLYTSRIIAGAVAASVPLSFWLLAFSVFLFLSLGFVKRYAELESMPRAKGAVAAGRGYTAADLPLVLNLGTASGYCAVVVMALYLNSPDAEVLYHHHKSLWLICPLMLYWVSRMWLLASRGQMHDDPVVFALRDRRSLAILGVLCLIVLLSI